MIFEGLFVAAAMGILAYMSAKTQESPRNGFVEWFFDVLFVFVPIVVIGLLVDLGPVLQSPSDFPFTISLALVALFALAILGRLMGRRMMSRKLPPVRLGLVFFVVTYVFFNIVALYFYLKEPS